MGHVTTEEVVEPFGALPHPGAVARLDLVVDFSNRLVHAREGRRRDDIFLDPKKFPRGVQQFRGVLQRLALLSVGSHLIGS